MIGIHETIDGKYKIFWVTGIKGLGTIIFEKSKEEVIEYFPGLCKKIKLKSNKHIEPTKK